MKKLEEIRKEYILRVLSDTCWDIKKASKILKISEKYLKKEIQKIRIYKKRNIQSVINLPKKDNF